jgi:hypothetical protein
MAKAKQAGKAGVTKQMISDVMREMGRKGGLKKVPKGAAMLSPEERAKSARRAAKARWSKKPKSDGSV